MEITIGYSNTKRRINGAFNICGRRKDLEAIANAIQEKLQNSSFDFCWVEVTNKMDTLVDQPVGEWD